MSVFRNDLFRYKARLWYALMFLFGLVACKENNSAAFPSNHLTNNNEMKIKITVGNAVATAVLYDNPTSRDFAARLPLTLHMEDYNKTEKIVVLASPLTSESAASGFDPSAGDLTYYEPWGNIALFYKDFGYSNGLISLGKIVSGLSIFEGKDTITVTFELDK
ncbi:hypothetical protein SAMN05421780_105161 [Flexibacter flexilis DSM 6793]|uniref:Cyclophilin-like domain-containing protein n=1 Tax=Flexibacter flexilis DSM 6793 TaxID=927664 RepID=A0A1I1J0V4_9BACT|nr:cyclophilin-like fold protein [Flexibacter flexilis]SFC42134.1 hypothetical protein SAMN05421780_105161 [Flexibacter flexilis DSM 6793]